MCTRMGRVDLIIEADERTSEWPRIEWLLCVTERVGDAQDPLQITNFILVPYSLEVQAGWGPVIEPMHLRPVV